MKKLVVVYLPSYMGLYQKWEKEGKRGVNPPLSLSEEVEEHEDQSDLIGTQYCRVNHRDSTSVFEKKCFVDIGRIGIELAMLKAKLTKSFSSIGIELGSVNFEQCNELLDRVLIKNPDLRPQLADAVANAARYRTIVEIRNKLNK